MLETVKNHWKEFLIEAWGLGTFMVSACGFGVLLFYSNSPLISLNEMLRNGLMGVAMGATAIGIICSSWGKRSGAHINPSVTLTFLRLGKIKSWDAFFYILAQFTGGTIGVLVSWFVLGKGLEDSMVNFVATTPNTYGVGIAFLSEFIISFLMMTMVLVISNSPKQSCLTPYLAGVLVAIFITFEAKSSGMSMNPARTFASAIVSNIWTSWWIYFIAPPMAMLLAAEIYLWVKGLKAVYCAKFHHHNPQPCIFICGFGKMKQHQEFIEVTKNQHLFTSVSNGLF